MVLLFETETGRIERELPIQQAPFSPDSRTLVGVGRGMQIWGDVGYPCCEVHAWDPATGKRLWGLPETPGFGAALFAPDGSLLFVGDRGGRLYEVRTGKVRREIEKRDSGRLLLGSKGEVRTGAAPPLQTSGS